MERLLTRTKSLSPTLCIQILEENSTAAKTLVVHDKDLLLMEGPSPEREEENLSLTTTKDQRETMTETEGTPIEKIIGHDMKI